MKTISKLSFLLPLAAVSSCTSHSCQEQKNEKSNVLFIAVDDLRDWTGYSTHFSNVKTPNLNKLAQQSMVFDHAYCAAPISCASRSAILSGKSPANTGVYTNNTPWRGELRKHITLTRQFMDDGYYVAGHGKIYHGSGDLQYWHKYDLVGKFHQCPENPDHPTAAGNPLDIPDSLVYDWQRATKTIEMINTDISSPLFLACGFVLPHLPWNAPRRFFDMYPLDSIQIPDYLEGDLDDVPPIGQAIGRRKMWDHYCKKMEWSHKEIVDSGLLKINIQAYLASVTFVDEQIGRVLDAWENSKYSDNGVIVLWGDHGWHMGEKEHWSKMTLWEEGTRTPFIIKTPDMKEGKVCSTPVSLLDIFPTLIDLCGLTRRPDLDGLSIVPLLNNPDIPWDRPAVTIWGQNNVSVRSKDWRYIHYCDGSKELYYHPNDPNEWTNLAGPDYMKIINQHHRWVPKCVPPTKGKKPYWFEKEGLVCE